ncbi:hypothetical protein N657DRAFT_562371 [Parathielavia appendiculata]|uniref:DUF7820 domain-containing protein n=1 Tax=Parathielavia appendiculata TaxID=2587402 RepID=A0AAN6U8J7_9PEZI|nr:hypothetical protein N657DRAFT_562371 [Parathielavia appendiculata]
MDSADKAGAPERRVSTRASARVSFDDGDEDYDLAVAGMVADGFRPTHSNGRTVPSTPSLTSASTATLHAEGSPASISSNGRPSSTAKPQMPQYILSIQNGPNTLTRSTTNSTNSTVYPAAESPYQGPSGPSHPYQMYPQNVRLARTLSMATSSTVPSSESSYRGTRGPSHPYGLYSQTGAVDPDTVTPAAIPLGFRGLADQYQRRIGPEGEDVADLIGPDGHTEQLPPYTRYPDEAYLRKAAVVDNSSDVVGRGATVVPPALTIPSSTGPSIQGAGGLGLATRNPEFDSTDDLRFPRSRHSTRSFTSDDSHRRFRLDDEGVSEKREPPKKWQAWMRRKAFGIVPYWAICLTGFVLLVMAIILGAVVGTFMNKEKRPPRRQGAWEPNYGATPIPTPPDLQPLPTGTFAMPLMTNSVSQTCIRDSTLSQAWSCNLVISGLTLTVTKDNDDYRASVNCNHSFTIMNHVYAYGEQPPLIQEPVTLDLVGDKFEPGRGPAWFKLLPFNKTVILPESMFGSPSAADAQNRARHVATSISGGVSNFKRKGIAQRGDKPWVCSWPNTHLVLFIYAQQNSSFTNWSKTMSASVSSPSTLSTSLTSSSTLSKLSTTTASSSPPPTPIDLSEAFTANEFPSSSRRWNDGGGDGHFPQMLADSAEYTTPSPPPPTQSRTITSSPRLSTTEFTSDTSSTTTTPTGPFGPVDTGDGFPPLPQAYPRVVKLEEHRVSTSGAPRAQCTQVEIQGPGEEARPVRDEQGRLVVIDIEEVDRFMSGSGQPIATATATADVERVRRGGDGYGYGAAAGVFGRGGGGDGKGPPGNFPDISPCGCMWFLT